ncbi:MAG TPA: CBS domain-containing protein [Desulfocapsa sulfexigens]|nr:CBS domain-containing protein [Desulfocapsa sulfexigens]
MSNPNDVVCSLPLEISDQDIFDAMKEIPGYLDITPGDFKDIYELVYRHTLQRLSESVKAADIMTGKVVTVNPETAVAEAAELMAAREVAGVPVVDSGNHVVGILTERDFLSRMGRGNTKTFMGVVARCLEGKGCAAMAIREKLVGDIMTSPVITVKESMNSMEISALLREKRINRVPVIDQQGCLVGIVSREDIVHTPLVKGAS